MFYFFDESGDFGFPENRFDSYVLAALICPDSELDEINRFVGDRTVTWNVAELHATDLTDDQLYGVADFIRRSRCELLAHVTDTVIVTADQIGKFRLDQAAALKRNLDWYREESTKAIGAPVPEIEKRMDREIKRSGLEAQMTHGEFVQARFLIELIFEALQKSLLIYHEDPWRNDFNEFLFVLDRKLPAKLGSGEKYLNDVILPALGSRSTESLVLVETWNREPQHPFIAKFRCERGRIRGEEATGVIDLSAMFGHGLTFARSHEQAGLQLVDVVAYIVRRAILEPDDRPIQLAYDQLRHSLRNDRRRCLTLERLALGREDPSSIDRYRELSALARPH